MAFQSAGRDSAIRWLFSAAHLTLATMSEPQPSAVPLPPLAQAGYREADDGGRAAGPWWDANAVEYLDDHADQLLPVDFVWGPEGLREEQAGLLGDVSQARVLEVGAGAAQCSRWLKNQGVRVVASDISGQMLAAGVETNRVHGIDVPLVQADARELPFADASFDVAFTSYGAIPFVPDVSRIHQEVARVLRPHGRWVFSVTHPIRWAFPDDPGERGLTAQRSYFDRRPYVELAEHDEITYAEYHRTLGDHVRDVVAAGFTLLDIVEPTWTPGRAIWGGWSELRGNLLPGTAVFVTQRAT